MERCLFSGGAVDCLLCGAEVETMEHFVMKCEGIITIRERHGVFECVRLEEVRAAV